MVDGILREVSAAKKAIVVLREERVTRQPTRIRPYVASVRRELERRIDRIERLGLADEIVALVGREHLVAVEKTTAALGEALGVDKTPRPAPSAASMGDALERLSRAIARYARKLLADLDEDDPASVARFERALAPIAEHKATLRARTGGAPPPAPDQPPAPDRPAEPAEPEAPQPTT